MRFSTFFLLSTLLWACACDTDDTTAPPPDADTPPQDSTDLAEDLPPDLPPEDSLDAVETEDTADPDGDDAHDVTADTTDADDDADTERCDRLFGLPTENTGLKADRCAPACACGEQRFTAILPTEALIQRLFEFSLDNPAELLQEDPYTWEEVPENTGVCAVTLLGDDNYRVDDFPAPESAAAAGAILTHYDGCGLCSSLQDLAVYMRYPDLTTPVKACGVLSLSEGDEAALACIRDLGFTEPCAQIWFYNTRHTREQCLVPCILALTDPYHLPDGSLNGCILCDEEVSGPIFKAVAGRTRRNTGLASALCRPCAEVRPLDHVYE